MSLKNPVTPLGINPGTVQLVAAPGPHNAWVNLQTTTTPNFTCLTPAVN